MDVNSIVSITAKPTDSSSGGNVILDQSEWSENSDVITRVDVADAILDMLYGTSDLDVECNLSDEGNFDIALYAFPYPFDLAFTVDVTRGTLSAPLITYHRIQETISFSLTKEETTRYPIASLVEVIHISNEAYDAKGNIVLRPKITLVDQELTIPEEMYYSAVVTYTTKRYRYAVKIHADENGVENYFQSVAWAHWNGGVRLEELKPPYNADSDYEQSQNCAWRSQLQVVGDDPDDPIPTADSDGKTINIAYCSQTIL